MKGLPSYLNIETHYWSFWLAKPVFGIRPEISYAFCVHAKTPCQRADSKKCNKVQHSHGAMTTKKVQEIKLLGGCHLSVTLHVEYICDSLI